MSHQAGSPNTGDIGRLITYAAALTALGVCALALVAARAGAAHRTADANARTHGLLYTGLVRAASGQCRGIYALGSACTHGPDPAPPGVDVTQPATLAQLQARARLSRAKGHSVAALPCSGNSPYSVQVIYAHLDGTTDKLATYRPLFEQYAEDIEWVFSASAGETGGQRLVRFVTDSNCELAIVATTVSATAFKDMAKMQYELGKQGFTATDRKYLVWMDGSDAYCGIGGYYPDTRPSTKNFNNGNAPSQFARVDQPCWGLLGTYGESVEAHELTHTLGAVSSVAPNGTAYGHCKDEWDAMCYVDGPGTKVREVCPKPHAALLDCNHDDYFSTNPPAQSWLSEHWNTANNRFLIFAGVAPPPPPPPPSPNPPPPPVPPQPAAVSAAKTTITAAAATLPADGKSETMITVQAKDSQGRNLGASGGVVELTTNAGKLSPLSDNHDGTYTARLTAPKDVTFATIGGKIAGQKILRPAFVAFVPAGQGTHTPKPKAKCVAPKLIGKTMFDAMLLVVRAHCGVKLSYAYSARVRSGRVVAQSPKAGTKLPSGGRISIVLSKGKRPGG